MKKAKLIIDGKEIEIEITQEQLEKLCPPKKNTGYERVKHSKTFWFNNLYSICNTWEDNTHASNEMYESANYYSDKTVAENNARADKLMRQLRRFAVEHREKELGWEKIHKGKCRIMFNWERKTLEVDYNQYTQVFGAIYFDTKENAQLALDAFKDELIWYFTEYKDSL